MSQPFPEIYLMKDAARVLYLSSDGVRYLVARGKLPAHRTPAGQLYFLRTDVERVRIERDEQKAKRELARTA